MTFIFKKSILDNKFIVNLINKCDIESKEKVVNLLVTYKKLSFQSELFISLNKSLLGAFAKIPLKKTSSSFKLTFSTQVIFLKNSRKINFFFRRTLTKNFIKSFFMRYNLILKKQKLQLNSTFVVLLNNFYFILLETLNEKLFDYTNNSMYKFDKGFMGDVLVNNNKNYKKNSYLINLKSEIYKSIAIINKNKFLLKINFFYKRFIYFNLNKFFIYNKVKAFDLQKFIVYFSLYDLIGSSLLQNKFNNIIINSHFHSKILKKSLSRIFFVQSNLKKNKFKNLKIILYNNKIFKVLLKFYLIFILLNEKRFKFK